MFTFMGKRHLAIAAFLRIEPSAVTKINTKRYEWAGQVYEIVLPKEINVYKGTISASHFVPYTFKGTEYRIREISIKTLQKEHNARIAKK